MSLQFNIDDIPDENPYNSNFNKHYTDDRPGLNFRHKLRDMDEFTATRQHFDEFGTYTRHPINRHARSKFMQFWKEEKRRCLEGYDLGRDWIPGYYYWYLNYGRLEKVVLTEEQMERAKKGEKVQVNRIGSFPDPWDYDYYWFHYLEEAEKAGKHASMLKSRGKGYSFKGASMVNRNYFLIPHSKSYVIANESGYLDGGDGILSRAFAHREFINTHTAFRKFSHKKNTVMYYRASKLVKNKIGQQLEMGSMAEVIGVTLKGDVGRARGKRGKLILWEESGNFPKLDEAWAIAKESIEQDFGVFGLMVAFGTSGSEQSSFQNLKEMFQKPKTFGILPVPDIWSEKARDHEVGMFCPSWTNINGFTDKDGNTDMYKAFKMEQVLYENLKKDGASPAKLTQHKMERPRRPEDALQKKGHNAFPVRALRDRLGELETNEPLFNSRYVGHMGIKEGRPEFIVDDNDIPVEVFPHDLTDDNSGAIVIYQRPMKRGGHVINDLYIAGTDPYDHDKSTTMSLGSLFIMNRISRTIVAEYTGRPDTAEEYWEQCRLLLLYYNARVNHENALVGFRNHLERKGNAYLMVEAPEVIQQLHRSSKNERAFGTPATPKINSHARTLISNWLKDKTGVDDETTYAETIESIPLIQELIDWDPDGNYDRVSALGMLMILEEELMDLEVKGARDDKETEAEDDDIWESMMFEEGRFEDGFDDDDD